MSIVVAANHHFWDSDNGDSGWMAGSEMDVIRHAFWPDDLRPLLRNAGVHKTVLVQTEENLVELDAEGYAKIWAAMRLPFTV